MATSKPRNLSFRVKGDLNCPICDFEFLQEKLHSGGGRLIAGKLTEELRRLYQPGKKYGKVYPLAYELIVCPSCLYTAFPKDFKSVPADELEPLQKRTVERRTVIEKVVGPVDFNDDRNLVLGAASYLLGIDCYQLRGYQVAPTPKKALCGLRGAWLFDDLHVEFPTLGFDKIRDFLYMKAVEYYQPTLDIMSTGKEPHEAFQNLLGPDTDNNWGFDGVVYLYGYLSKRFLKDLAPSPEQQIEILDRCKRYLGKLYGMGRASKNKPSIMIDMSKELYESISAMLDELTGEGEAAEK